LDAIAIGATQEPESLGRVTPHSTGSLSGEGKDRPYYIGLATGRTGQPLKAEGPADVSFPFGTRNIRKVSSPAILTISPVGFLSPPFTCFLEPTSSLHCRAFEIWVVFSLPVPPLQKASPIAEYSLYFRQSPGDNLHPCVPDTPMCRNA
jgi:hypothetical protein